MKMQKLNLGVLSLAVVFLMVISAANGRKYVGEYWGEKAMAALVDAKSNGQRYAAEYWGEKALETLNDVGKLVKEFEPKPNHVVQWHPEVHDHDEAETNTLFVTDFVVKPNLQC